MTRSGLGREAVAMKHSLSPEETEGSSRARKEGSQNLVGRVGGRGVGEAGRRLSNTQVPGKG